jgi:hypothetical protein
MTRPSSVPTSINVVDLAAARRDRQQKRDVEVIELARALLKLAMAGHIDGLIVAYNSPDGCHHYATGTYRASPVEGVRAAGALQSSMLLQALREQE